MKNNIEMGAGLINYHASEGGYDTSKGYVRIIAGMNIYIYIYIYI